MDLNTAWKKQFREFVKQEGKELRAEVVTPFQVVKAKR